MVNSAALLLGRLGVSRTSVPKVLAHSDGPRGSVGHHFPGGRTELLSEAVRSVGDSVSARLRDAAESGAAPAAVYAAIAQHYRAQLVGSDFVAGCPVWAVVQEAHDDPALGSVVAGIVDEWVELLACCLVRHGYDEERARESATVCVSALEGAIAMSRVRRSVEPIDLTLDAMLPLLSAA